MSSGFNSKEQVRFTDISATSDTFQLRGGRYGVEVNAGAWHSGSVTLEKLAIDGSTWVAVASQFLADGIVILDLPAASYRFEIAGPTDVYAEVMSQSIPKF
jgi:hypothetical protein